MPLRLTTGPAVEPVEVSEVKLHSRIDTDADDAKIAVLIKAAREFLESVTNRQFITATYTLTMDRFPGGDDIELPIAPLQSVESIKYLDASGNQQTLSGTAYDAVIHDDGYGHVYVDRSVGWPSVGDYRNAVEIIYTCGHGDTAATVPERIKQAIYLLVAHWYEHREAVVVGTISSELPMSLRMLISNIKIRGAVEAYESGLVKA